MAIAYFLLYHICVIRVHAGKGSWFVARGSCEFPQFLVLGARTCVMCNNIVYINRGLPPTEKSDTFRHKKELILMPWEERNVTKAMLRKEFVERVLAHEKSKKALCLEYGISRPTGDKWIQRYRENSSCEELSREPHHRANRTPPEMEALVIKTRKENYDACALVVHTLLKRQVFQTFPVSVPLTISFIGTA